MHLNSEMRNHTRPMPVRPPVMAATLPTNNCGKAIGDVQNGEVSFVIVIIPIIIIILTWAKRWDEFLDELGGSW